MTEQKSLLNEFIEEFHIQCYRGVMMRDYTSLRIGGEAPCLLVPDDAMGLKSLVDILRVEDRGYLIIGGGTNMLIKDGGVDEVVISLKNFGTHQIVRDDGDDVVYFAQAGVSLQAVVRETINKGLAGMEGLIGIPGTVGGALFGNAGAYGYQIMDVVEKVTILREGVLRIFNREELYYGYRTGGFLEGDVVLGVHLLLRKGDSEEIKKAAQGYLREKKKTQPLGEPSAGCVFKNPEGVSAGRLIEESGLKGMRVGDIEVSRVHANFFINKGRGSSQDFIRLMDMVREKVLSDHGVVLEPEIRIYGKD